MFEASSGPSSHCREDKPTMLGPKMEQAIYNVSGGCPAHPVSEISFFIVFDGVHATHKNTIKCH